MSFSPDSSVPCSILEILSSLYTNPLSFETQEAKDQRLVYVAVFYHEIMSQLHHSRGNSCEALISAKSAVELAKSLSKTYWKRLLFRYVVLLLHFHKIEQAISEWFLANSLPLDLDHTNYEILYKQQASLIIHP